MTNPNTAPVEQVDREMATAIRAALYRGYPNMPSYPDGIVPPLLAAIRLATTAPLQARIERLEAINAELLETLEILVGEKLGGDDVTTWRPHDNYRALIGWHDRARARAAIASAQRIIGEGE